LASLLKSEITRAYYAGMQRDFEVIMQSKHEIKPTTPNLDNYLEYLGL